MKKQTVHFVYATPSSLIDRVTQLLLNKKIWHPPWNGYRWPSPVCAPLSITYNIAKRLSQNFSVKIYNLWEKTDIRPQDGDILLGHILNDPESITWRALENPAFSKKYIIGPYSHYPTGVVSAYRALEKCDIFFAICGKYWIDTLHESPFNVYKDKIVQLNMAINSNDYPYIRKEFNAPGKRKFLYIGRNAPEKGTDLLERLAKCIPSFDGAYISPRRGKIEGWKKINCSKHLKPAIVSKLSREYDFFINMSRADAQATTILEAMSWGFPVACTKESGYDHEGIFSLSVDDWEHNMKVVSVMQSMDTKRLFHLSEANRSLIEQEYNWESFLNKLEHHILEGSI